MLLVVSRRQDWVTKGVKENVSSRVRYSLSPTSHMCLNMMKEIQMDEKVLHR